MALEIPAERCKTLNTEAAEYRDLPRSIPLLIANDRRALSRSDPWFSALDTLGYYKSLAEAYGGLNTVSAWSRIFLVPGMTHCGGGPALDHFDMLTAVVNWVEKGTAPDSVTATGAAFPGRSRPLCPYPKHAQYNGNGDIQDAHNFQCQDS